MKRVAVGNGYQYLLNSVVKGDHEQHRGSMASYFLASGTPSGKWYGNGFSSLDKPVEPFSSVTEKQMKNLFGAGLSPNSGGKLGRAFAKYDGDGGGSTRQAVSGFDFTFNPAKSFSVAWALADEEMAEKIRQIHHHVMETVIKDIEKKVATTRTGKDGVNFLQTTGIMATAFDHWDSRSHDPHLHTHLVISNKTQGVDGKWRTLDSATLFRATVTLSETYNSRLMDETAKQLGWNWNLQARAGDGRNSQWEIDGVPTSLIEHFSSRNRNIEARKEELVANFLQTHGHMPNAAMVTKMRDRATRETRPDKEIIPLGHLRNSWAKRAKNVTGLDGAEIVKTLGGHSFENIYPTQKQINKMVENVLFEVSDSKATFTHWNLSAQAHRATRHLRLTREQRDLLVEQISEQALTLAIEATPKAYIAPAGFDFRAPRAQKYTTQKVLDAEQRLLHASKTYDSPNVNVDVADAIAKTSITTSGHTLSDTQLKAVVQVTTSQALVDVLVGPAGAGKSTVMGVVRKVWEKEHGKNSVVGVAPSQKAAKVLSEEIGVPTFNTQKWLYETVGEGYQKRYEKIVSLQTALTKCGSAKAAKILHLQLKKLVETNRKYGLQKNQLLIVDEASLAGTHALDALRAQAETVGAKVLLVGDHNQLQSVESGGAFGMLVRSKENPATLSEVRRFKNGWEAAASLQLRLGDPTVTETYAKEGKLVGGDMDSMLQAAYEAWKTDILGNKVSLLIAPDIETVRSLNEQAQKDQLEANKLGKNNTTICEGVARVGDVVVTRKNDSRTVDKNSEMVANRDLWTVQKIHPSGALTLQRAGTKKRKNRVTVNSKYANDNVQLGYALTAHGAQGVTVDTAHAVITRASTRQLLYVAATRAKENNQMYLVTGDDTPYSPEAQITKATEVFNHVLHADGAEISATEQTQTEHQKWFGLEQMVNEYVALSHDADKHVWENWVNNTEALTETQKGLVLQGEAYPSLVQSLRQAKSLGITETDFVSLIKQRELESAQDLAQVLHWRIDAWRKKQQNGEILSGCITGTDIIKVVSTDPVMQQALQVRENRITELVEALPKPNNELIEHGSSDQAMQNLGVKQKTSWTNDHVQLMRNDQHDKPHWQRQQPTPTPQEQKRAEPEVFDFDFTR